MYRLARKVGSEGRLRSYHQPAALVAPDAWLVPLRHHPEQHRRELRLDNYAGDRHPHPDPGPQFGPELPPLRSPNVFTRTPERARSTARKFSSGTSLFERELPCELATKIAYVGTKTDGGYADLNINYGEPGGGNATRKYFAVAGTTTINSWGHRTKTRYNGLQVELNRPFRHGLMLKGAYTLSAGEEHGRRRRVGRPHLEPPVEVRRQLRAGRVRPNPHRPDGVPVRAAVPQDERRARCTRSSAAGR